MPKLDSYLFREFAQTTFAALVVLMIVSLGAVFADVLGDIVRGRVPAGMMLAQLGLQVLNYLPLILPLGLMLGLLLSVGRLYRDSEMPVLTSIGVGPRRLLRPLMLLVVPFVLLIGACSLWLGPWARQYSQQMIEVGQRSLLVAGLEAFPDAPVDGVDALTHRFQAVARLSRAHARSSTGNPPARPPPPPRSRSRAAIGSSMVLPWRSGCGQWRPSPSDAALIRTWRPARTTSSDRSATSCATSSTREPSVPRCSGTRSATVAGSGGSSPWRSAR